MKNMKKTLLVGVILSVVLVPVLASAASVQMGERYVLAEAENIAGNFYVAGSELNFDGEIAGDLYAAGEKVYVRGGVSEDVALAGGEIEVNGTVGDDVRMVGGTLTVRGAIAGDLVVAGGTLRVLSKARIGGDVIMAGGTMLLEGEVVGDVRLVGGEATLGGVVGGDVISSVEQLRLTTSAIIVGDLTNRSQYEAELASGAIVHGNITNEPSPYTQSVRGMLASAGATSFLMFLFAGLICLWLFKNRSAQLVAHALANFGKEVLRGVVVLVAVPVIALALFFTIIGIPVSVALMLFYVVLLIIARIFAGIMLGGWINRVVFKKPDQVFNWQTVIGGNVVLFALSFAPFFGSLIAFVFMLVALGAFWGYVHRHFWVRR